jgi:hypothetical protein
MDLWAESGEGEWSEEWWSGSGLLMVERRERPLMVEPVGHDVNRTT